MCTVEPEHRTAPTFEWGDSSLADVSERTGLSVRYLRAVKNGHKWPSSDAERRIRLALASDRSVISG